MTSYGSPEHLPVARALRADASQAVAQDLSLGTAVAACMSLLVSLGDEAGGDRASDGFEQDLTPGFPQSLLPVDYSKAFLALQDDGDSPLDIVTALGQVRMRSLSSYCTVVGNSIGTGGVWSRLGKPAAVSPPTGPTVFGDPTISGGFVTGWPFVAGIPGTEVPSFALVAAALSSFPPRRLASNAESADPCAARLPALANSALCALVRSGFPFNIGGASAGNGLGVPSMSSASAATAPAPTGGFWAGAATAAAATVTGLGGSGAGFVKPLADSLSPDDAYHLREALVAAGDNDEADGSDDAAAAAVEERRAAALELLLSAVKEQPALVVVLFWAQPTRPQAAGEGSIPPAGTDEAAGSAVVVGGPALSRAVLSALNALSVELADVGRGLFGELYRYVFVPGLNSSSGVVRYAEYLRLRLPRGWFACFGECSMRSAGGLVLLDGWKHPGGVFFSKERRVLGAADVGADPRATARLCHTLRCHAVVLEILALEMHRGLRPLGASALPPALQTAALPGSSGGGGEEGKDSLASSGDGDKDAGGEEGVEGSRAAAKAVEGFIRKNIEAYFGCWTSTYTLFSLDPRLVRITAKRLAADLGISLDDVLAVPARERVSGDGFLYHIPGLERLVGLSPHGDGHPAGESSAEDGEESAQLVVHGSHEAPKSAGRGSALRVACEAANRNWSLAEAEAAVLRAFRVFVEVCVLRRQPGYQSAPPPPPALSASTPASAGNSGGSGEVSPARTPVVVSRAGGSSGGGGGGGGMFGGPAAGAAVVVSEGSSDFLGDKRSFAMVKIAAHRLAGEKRKGWAVVNVVAEMCEALVSMLHHQLHEVVQKALEPRRCVVRRRDPSLGRLSRGVRGQMGYDACDQTLRTLAPALESLFDVAPLSRVVDVDEGVGGLLEANVISRARCERDDVMGHPYLVPRPSPLRVRLCIFVALDLRIGWVHVQQSGRLCCCYSAGERRSSSTAGGGEEYAEESTRLSREARLKLLRRACGTLRELDFLEEALKGGGSGSSRRGKRGPGASMLPDLGSLEAEGDRTLRAHIVEACVSIMEEMTIPRAYMAGGTVAAADGGEWQSEREAGVMASEVERIVREEKVIPRLLERAGRASRLASSTFGPLHTNLAPQNTSSSSSANTGGGAGLDMDVEESEAGAGGGRAAGKGSPDSGTAIAEGVELLQLIFGFFASAAGRGLCIKTMLDDGVLTMMTKDPTLALVRQASKDTQSSVPRGYTQQSELSPHWRCYSLALRTVSDLAHALHAAKGWSPPPSATPAARIQGTAGWATSGRTAAAARGVAPREGIGAREAETGLAQVFHFVSVFRGTMVEGLSTLPPGLSNANVTAAAGGGGGGRLGGRLTLALMQERVDVAGVVASLGPWMARWRAQHFDTSVDVLEALRQATRTAAVLLVPATGPPPTKASSGGSTAAPSQTPSRGNSGGGGGWSSPVNRRRSLEDFTPMQQATPTPARGAAGGTTPARLSSGGAAAAPGGGGGGATGADSRPLELINACALAVTDYEKVLLENQSSFSAAAASSGGAGHYPSPMTMATPTPVRGGGGGIGGVFAPRGAGLASVSGGAVGGEQGFLGRVEDGLTAFLVLSLGVLRRVSPQPRDMNIEIHPGERGSIEAPVGAMIECKFRRQQAHTANGESKNAEQSVRQSSGGGPSSVIRVGTVIGRDPRGLGYVARFEAASPGGGFSDELVPWEYVVAIKDPGAAIPIFSYQALHSLPHLQHLHPPHSGILKASSSAATTAGGGATAGARSVGVGADRQAGLLFEGLYEEPSLGHLVGLVRYFVHQMEIVSNEEDSAVGAGDIVSNDERDMRRWRLGQMGFITEASLWMLVVNAVAHEGGGGGAVEGEAGMPSPVERGLLHDELLELFDTRLDEHASLWENLSRGEGGRAPVSISPAFVAHVKGMVLGWLDTARARKKEKDATTPKSRAAGKGGRRGAAGGAWNPLGGGVGMMRQGSDMSVARTSSLNRGW
ncbi:unnamed protein product [Scytosiphon promiscuus]